MDLFETLVLFGMLALILKMLIECVIENYKKDK